MIRFMADSIDSNQIPTDAAIPGMGQQPISLRCGYLGGSYQQSSHRGPVDVNIDVNGAHPEADVLDIEVGDATPDAAPGWVKRHNATSSFPGILYCNRSTMRAVANACQATGLTAGTDYFWWISTLDGTTKLPDMTGVLAIQAWGANYFPGHNIDVSIVYDDSWKTGADMPLTDADVAKIMDWSFGPLLPGGENLSFGQFLKAMASFLQDATGGDLRNLIAMEQGEQKQITDLAAKVGTGQPTVNVDPVALANALLANQAAVAKLGDAIAAGLANRVHNG